jgi:POT family proton-dependent oligopeptide transporter
MVTKLADEKETGVAMGGWFMSIAMAQYVGGLIAYLAAGGGGHGVSNGLSITQYSSTFMQLVWLGLAFGIVYLIAAPAINKLMHGVK